MKTAYEQRRLKYAATLNDEVLPESTPPDYELAYIDIGNVSSSAGILGVTDYSFVNAPSRARRKVQHGDVIVSTVRTYLQAIAPIENPAENLIVSTGFAVVRPRQEVLSSRYAKYALREVSFLAEVEKRSTGVSYPAINASDLGDIRIPLPPLPQQEAIADYLDRETARLDQLTAARQRQLKLLEAKRRAIIAQAVTQGLKPEVPRQPTQWFGPVPAHWKMLQVKRLFAQVDYGVSDSLEAQGNVGVLRMGDIQSGEVRLDNLGFTDEVPEALILRENDLLFNRTNSLDQIGKVGLFRGGEQPVSFASYLVRFRCNELALPEYMNFLLNTRLVMDWGRNEALPAIGQANLNPNRYGYLQVVIPPVDEQEHIVSYLRTELKQLDELHHAITRSLHLLEKKRASLIAAAVMRQTEFALEAITN